MKKLITPCKAKAYTKGGKEIEDLAFCKIEYINGRLSITGVVSPLNSGDCRGSCGQCVDSIRNGTPLADNGWDKEMLDRFCDIWDEYHLNDMSPCCSHMRDEGMLDIVRRKVFEYHYILKSEFLMEKSKIKTRIIDEIKKGNSYSPTDYEVNILNLEYSLTRYSKISEEEKQFYKLDGSESKFVIRGNIRYGDYPEIGLLGKPCEVCGEKYGHKWYRIEVPDEVIEWLEKLPDAVKECPWSSMNV